MEIRACSKCGKMGYWYALCHDCRKKIDEAYKKMMEQKK